MKFGLKPEVIGQIIKTLAEFAEIEEAILYGSRAKGNYKPGSDIDLTLKGDSIQLQVLNSLRGKLNDLSIPYIIDLSIYHNIKDEELLAHISKVVKTFYKKATLYRGYSFFDLTFASSCVTALPRLA